MKISPWQCFLALACAAGVFAATAPTAPSTPAPAAPAASSPKTGKIKVLIVDGYSNHNWRLTTELIKLIVEPTGLFEVAVSTCPPRADAPGYADWRPRFKDYEVVLVNLNSLNNRGPAWPKATQEDFVSYVREGGGVFIFHSANNSFAEWPEYNEIIGLGWRTPDQGVALRVESDGTIVRIPAGEGERTSHGPRADVVLHRLGDHPMHKDMPREWTAADIETYYYVRGPAQNVEVLSWAFEPRTRLNWPIEWTVAYGKGRVYNFTLGHVWPPDTDPVSMRCVGLQTLLIRGLEWLAGRPVTHPLPKDFPTKDAASVRPYLRNPPAPAGTAAALPANASPATAPPAAPPVN